MKRLLIILALCSAAFGQASHISVSATSRQAVVSYQASSTAACTIRAYKDSARSQLYPDSDASLYPNADNDLARYPQTAAGIWRQFVIGSVPEFQRAYVQLGTNLPVLASDNNNYSLALPADSQIYGRSICDGSTVDFLINTKSIPNRIYPLPMPITADGHYAFPTLNFSSRSNQVVDPMTGAKLQLTGLPRDDINDLTNKIPTSTAGGTNWVNPANAIANVSDATYSGTTQDWLWVLVNVDSSASTKQIYSADWVKATFTASSTGTGNDAVLQVADSPDGGTTIGNINDVTLTSTAGTANCYPFGANGQDCAAAPAPVNTWFPVTNQLQWQTHIWNNPNFAIGFRVKGSGATGTTSLRNVKVNIGRSYESLGAQIGNQFLFSFTQIPDDQGTYWWIGADPQTGGEGAHYFAINTAVSPAVIHYLGRAVLPTTPGAQTSAGNGFIVNTNMAQFDHSDATITYTLANLCAVASESGACPSGLSGKTVVKAKMPAAGSSYYRSDAAQGAQTNVNFTGGVTLMTPLSTGNLEALALAFDSNYDSSKFDNWTLDCIQGSAMVLSVIRSSQNSYGWQFVFNLNTSQIVAGRRTWTGPVYTYEGFHNNVCLDDSSPGMVSTVHHGLTGCSGNPPGCGPYTTTLQTTLNGTDAPGTVVTISVAGDMTSATAETTLQSYLPGDYLQDGSGSTLETLLVVANHGGNSIDVSRGFGVGTNASVHVAAHAIGSTITAIGNTGWWAVQGTTARTVYWDYIHDPHGTDATGTYTVISSSGQDGGHEAVSQGTVNGVSQQVRVSDAGGPQGGYSFCYGLTVLSLASCPATNLLGEPQATTFAGVQVTNGAADWQKHPASPHNVAASAAQQNTALDVQGAQQPGLYLLLGSETQVNDGCTGCPGTLWKIVANNYDAKQWGQFATAGSFPLHNISAPGSVIDASSATWYSLCIAGAVGECRPGSSVGDMFVNAPFTATPALNCFAGSSEPVLLTLINVLCIGNHPSTAESTLQFYVDKNDPTNQRVRVLTGNLTAFGQQSFGAAAMVTPDGNYMWSPCWLREMTAVECLVKIPSFPLSSNNSGEYMQVPYRLSPLANATHTYLRVARDPAMTHFDARTEPVAMASATYSQTNPYFYETTERASYTGVNCTSACAPLLNAIGDTVVFVQPFYGDNSNTNLLPGAGETAVAVPY